MWFGIILSILLGGLLIFLIIRIIKVGKEIKEEKQQEQTQDRDSKKKWGAGSIIAIITTRKGSIIAIIAIILTVLFLLYLLVASVGNMGATWFIIIGLIISLLVGLIPAIIAKNKGKKFLLWWLFGMFIAVIALPWSIILTPESEIEQQKGKDDLLQYTKRRDRYILAIIATIIYLAVIIGFSAWMSYEQNKIIDAANRIEEIMNKNY